MSKEIKDTLSEEEIALNNALNILEDILENRQVVSDAHHQDTSAELPLHDEELPLNSDEDLPVLNEVVIPGNDFIENIQIQPQPEHVEIPQHNDLIARLVNEMNVIIESSVDDALTEAKKEVMAKLKNHLDIVLPEIVDEILRRCTERQR